MVKTTVSILKADVGGFPGHATVHPELIRIANEHLKEGQKAKTIVDFHVSHCGDDLELIMSHTAGTDAKEIHKLAWDVFLAGTEKAKELGLYGAGQDMLSDAFCGTVRGMGPGVAELTFTERKAEPVVAFMMDKTEPGAFNLPMFKAFADPFNTAGLVIDPTMHNGFVFEVWDIDKHTFVNLNTPEELHDLLCLIGAKSRFVIKRIFPRPGGKLPADEPAACVSTEKLYQIAGEYVGKDDPVALARGQAGLPALGELIEPFTMAHLVSGWMRGSHNGPLMPVGVADANCTRFDGPPRVVALGFQVKNSRLCGPVDLFADRAYDLARAKANDIAEYMRRHGPFEPHRLHLQEMEYTTFPKVMEELKGRFKKLD
jgi:fructose 1,6-bisphosphate aldolase/phosphatase